MGVVKVTTLGHASVLVEMNGAVGLMDPIFFDPFEEGAFVSCPKRVVHHKRLLPVDIRTIASIFSATAFSRRLVRRLGVGKPSRTGRSISSKPGDPVAERCVNRMQRGSQAPSPNSVGLSLRSSGGRHSAHTTSTRVIRHEWVPEHDQTCPTFVRATLFLLSSRRVYGGGIPSSCNLNERNFPTTLISTG